MLEKQSEQIRFCYEHAADAKRKAEGTADAELKIAFLEMEERWLALAQSYAFSERVGHLVAANSQWRLNFEERARAKREGDPSLRLQEISTLLIQEGNLDALYQRVLEAAMSLMSAEMGSIQKYDPEQDQLRLLTSRGISPRSGRLLGTS